jgi:hypothetical protein
VDPWGKGLAVELFSRNNIVRAFEALSSELGSEGPPSELVIAGGAALVLLYGARDSTKDVDAVISDTVVKRAARRVAAQLELPEDWLNDGAKGFLQGVAMGEIVFQTRNLVVRTLAPKQLLAMKLGAWRDDLDIADARLLLSKLTGAKDEVWRTIEPYVMPGRELKTLYAFEDLWESAHGTS